MKILGCGWAKTGTTTLGQCLTILGYNHRSQDFGLVRHLGEPERILRAAEPFDSFEDWPWLLLFREFDQAYPGSKFILTVRDPRKWLASYRKQLRDQGIASPEMNRIRTTLYGLPFPKVTDEQLLDRYDRHNRDVRDYFAGRDNFLEVNWEGGDGWEKLCGFLGKPVPDMPLPHANRASERHPAIARIRSVGSYVLRRIRSGAGD